MKKTKWFKAFYLSTAVISLFVLMAALAGCGSDSSAYDPYEAYNQACADAAVVTPDKISKNLTPIIAENPNLIWEDNVVGSRVLVVSWVDENACNIYKCPPEGCAPGDTCKEGRECAYSRDSYVTLAPELKNFFLNRTPDPMRIAQVLGLPPVDSARKVCFLEMWVSPEDLFRPAPDPEVTDSEAEMDLPPSQYRSRFRQYSDAELVFADMACDPELCPSCNQWNQCGFTTYENYFKNRRKYIYTAASPYPWTGLGYTYDWGNPDNPVGLSEFVVNGKKSDGSTINVGIKAVTYTADYFAN